MTCLAVGGVSLVERLHEFSDTLSPPVAAAVPDAVRCVEAWLANSAGSSG